MYPQDNTTSKSEARWMMFTRVPSGQSGTAEPITRDLSRLTLNVPKGFIQPTETHGSLSPHEAKMNSASPEPLEERHVPKYLSGFSLLPGDEPEPQPDANSRTKSPKYRILASPCAYKDTIVEVSCNA